MNYLCICSILRGARRVGFNYRVLIESRIVGWLIRDFLNRTMFVDFCNQKRGVCKTIHLKFYFIDVFSLIKALSFCFESQAAALFEMHIVSDTYAKGYHQDGSRQKLIE